MKMHELRELSDNDLKARLKETIENQFTLRFQSATTPLDNPLKLRENRKVIARILTILQERKKGKK
ncbi:MAG: 50S ribosomal protein L29 [Candidatus Coatesbacteria bacterium]|nr:50S ribosomal protein L29 [Candidatus Coatesbacteria bacterium]